jgi:hypothetical protein
MEGFLNPYDWVEAGNRTSKTLTVTYDGKSWELPPYPAVNKLPQIVARKAIEQHPLMGSEDPTNPNYFISLVFVRGWEIGGEPMADTPIEQSRSIERIDVSLLDPDRQRGRETVHFGRLKPERMHDMPGASDSARTGSMSTFSGDA